MIIFNKVTTCWISSTDYSVKNPYLFQTYNTYCSSTSPIRLASVACAKPTLQNQHSWRSVHQQWSVSELCESDYVPVYKHTFRDTYTRNIHIYRIKQIKLAYHFIFLLTNSHSNDDHVDDGCYNNINWFPTDRIYIHKSLPQGTIIFNIYRYYFNNDLNTYYILVKVRKCFEILKCVTRNEVKSENRKKEENFNSHFNPFRGTNEHRNIYSHYLLSGEIIIGDGTRWRHQHRTLRVHAGGQAPGDNAGAGAATAEGRILRFCSRSLTNTLVFITPLTPI